MKALILLIPLLFLMGCSPGYLPSQTAHWVMPSSHDKPEFIHIKPCKKIVFQWELPEGMKNSRLAIVGFLNRTIVEKLDADQRELVIDKHLLKVHRKESEGFGIYQHVTVTFADVFYDRGSGSTEMHNVVAKVKIIIDE